MNRRSQMSSNVKSVPIAGVSINEIRGGENEC